MIAVIAAGYPIEMLLTFFEIPYLGGEGGDILFHFFSFVQVVLGMGPENDEEADGYDLYPHAGDTGAEQYVQETRSVGSKGIIQGFHNQV